MQAVEGGPHSKIKRLYLPKKLGYFTRNSDDPIFWL